MIKKFEIKSGKVVLSDPCYKLGTWCQGVIENVKNGEWNAEAEHTEHWGRRVSALAAFHKDHFMSVIAIKAKGEKLDFTGGVDSGQFGYFDFDGYRKDETIAGVKRNATNPEHIICENEPWYSMCCDRTITDDCWGVIPLGVVASSGLGDGSYDTYGVKDEDGKYVAFATIFIGDDEGEEMNDDEGEEMNDDEF